MKRGVTVVAGNMMYHCATSKNIQAILPQPDKREAVIGNKL